MRPYSWLLVLRASCLVALGMSAALWVDYTGVESHFCGATSGCGAIRLSGFGYVPFPFVGRLPVPVFGLAGFTLLFAATLARSAEIRRRLCVPLAASMGAVALAFIALQFYLAHFCWMCLMVDGSAVLVAVSCMALRGRGFQDAQSEEESRSTLMDPQELSSEGQRVKGVWRDDSQVYDAPNPLVRPAPREAFRLRLWAWVALPTAVVGVPLLFPVLVQTSDVPAQVRALYEEGEPTFVEFFDFECPHCQDLSPRLKRLVEHDGKCHLRFGYVPLPGHDAALAAARVSICAAEQNKEKEVVGALFERRAFALAESSALGKSLVPDAAAFDACLSSERPEARLNHDLEVLKAAGFEGLPTTYIGGTRILGAREDLVYFDALRRARDGSDRSGMSPWAYFSAMGALLLALVLLGRVPAGDRRSISSPDQG